MTDLLTNIYSEYLDGTPLECWFLFCF